MIELCPYCKDGCENCNGRGWAVVEDSSITYQPVFDFGENFLTIPPLIR